MIAGGRVAARVGDVLQICGKPFVVHGRMEPTGVGPFDGSYFVSFDALAAINALNHTQPGGKAADGGNVRKGLPAPLVEINAEADACNADLPPGRISAFLLQLSPGTKVEDVKFSIAQLPGIRIVEGNAVLTNSRQALGPLFLGIVTFALSQLVALMIVVSLLFSAIVQERYREVGLLRAMGARPNHGRRQIIQNLPVIPLFGAIFFL